MTIEEAIAISHEETALEGHPSALQHNPAVRKRLSFILNNLEEGKDQMILDVGTGSGLYIHHLSCVGDCIGIDVDVRSLQKARNRNVQLARMVAEDLAFKNDTFDTVTMIEVLEHVANDQEVIRNIFKVLRLGGRLIVTAPNKLFPFETHGFRTGSKCYTMSVPLLPYLPEMLRKRFSNARVYIFPSIEKMLAEEGFSIRDVRLLSPSLVQLKSNLTRFRRVFAWLQELLDIAEDRALPILYNIRPTIAICAEKVKK